MGNARTRLGLVAIAHDEQIGARKLICPPWVGSEEGGQGVDKRWPPFLCQTHYAPLLILCSVVTALRKARDRARKGNKDNAGEFRCL